MELLPAALDTWDESFLWASVSPSACRVGLSVVTGSWQWVWRVSAPLRYLLYSQPTSDPRAQLVVAAWSQTGPGVCLDAPRPWGRVGGAQLPVLIIPLQPQGHCS